MLSLPRDIENIVVQYIHEARYIDIMKCISSGRASFIPSCSRLSEVIESSCLLAPIDIPFDGWDFLYESDEFESTYSYTMVGSYCTFNITFIYSTRCPDYLFDPDEIEFDDFYFSDVASICEVFVVEDAVFRSYRQINGPNHCHRLS